MDVCCLKEVGSRDAWHRRNRPLLHQIARSETSGLDSLFLLRRTLLYQCVFTAAILHFNDRLSFVNQLVIHDNCDDISIYNPIYILFIYCISYYYRHFFF